MTFIYPVILSGGAGTRLWPLSRSFFPKQLLALAGTHTFIQDTALRVTNARFAPPAIICNREHRFVIADQMRATGISPAILLEPVGRNTAPAAAVAALWAQAQDPDAIVLLMPSDHLIRDPAAFESAVEAAIHAAARDHLVTFGIEPTRPETGYGYIQRGDELYGLERSFSVRRFVEKPDATTAQGYVDAGDYYWNSGIFAFRARTFLEELGRIAPDILEAARGTLEQSHQETDFLWLAETPFAACRSISIDYAVMEHTDRAAIVPVEMGWSDLGSWESLWDVSDKDDQGNVVRGDVVRHGVRNSYLHSEGPTIAAIGTDDLVVVATKDAVLVSHKSHTQDVKNIVDQLQQKASRLHTSHAKVHRPWGTYEGLESGDNFQVKHIVVNPGAKLSLQMHHKRAEHWIVVSGSARVTCGDRVFEMRENESTFIPLGARHRLENTGPAPLHLIEVQCGSYLGEDDIVRFEDTYGR